MKLTKPGELRSFAAYPRCSADPQARRPAGRNAGSGRAMREVPTKMAAGSPSKLVVEALPEFANELEQGLKAQGRADLVSQLDSLPLVARCQCGEKSCATFYVVPPAETTWGPGHENVIVDALAGRVVLDVVRGRIVAIEVVDREDVRRRLQAVIPE